MKRLPGLLVLLGCCGAAYGQGQFVFNNRILPDIDAPFQLTPDPASALVGSQFSVQLLGGPAGTPVAQLLPLGSTDFRTFAPAAGYVNPLTVIVPGVAGGQNAEVVLRVFQGSGPSGVELATFGPFSAAVATPPAIPPNLALGVNPLIICPDCPEPSTLLLMMAGGAAILLALGRNRQQTVVGSGLGTFPRAG